MKHILAELPVRRNGNLCIVHYFSAMDANNSDVNVWIWSHDYGNYFRWTIDGSGKLILSSRIDDSIRLSQVINNLGQRVCEWDNQTAGVSGMQQSNYSNYATAGQGTFQ